MMSLTCLKDGCHGNIQVDDEYCAQEVVCPECNTRYDYEYDEFETEDGEWMDAPMLTEIPKE